MRFGELISIWHSDDSKRFGSAVCTLLCREGQQRNTRAFEVCGILFDRLAAVKPVLCVYVIEWLCNRVVWHTSSDCVYGGGRGSD